MIRANLVTDEFESKTANITDEQLKEIRNKDIHNLRINEIPYYIPKDIEDKKVLANQLQTHIMDFIFKNIDKVNDPVELLEMFLEKNEIDFYDVDDYVLLMEDFINLVETKYGSKYNKTSLGSLF